MSLSFPALRSVRVHGKFLSRDGGRFLIQATRLAGVEGALDLSEKLALRRRLDELADANINTLILSAAQAEHVLGVAGQAGLHALVEIAIAPAEVESAEAARRAIARVARTVNVLRGYRGLIGFILEAPHDDAAVTAAALEALRRGLAGLARTIHESHHGVELIGMARRLETRSRGAGERPLSEILAETLREDFSYFKIGRMEAAELGDTMLTMHRAAAGRPLVIELGEENPGQVEMVARAFGLGTAGVVAPAMQPAASPGWRSGRSLSAGELLPFGELDGSSIPLPQATPHVSVVVFAADDD